MKELHKLSRLQVYLLADIQAILNQQKSSAQTFASYSSGLESVLGIG